jgi:uncharacterized protein
MTPEDVTDNRDAQQFELQQDGHLALLSYNRQPDSIVLVHTEVPPELRGRRVGTTLVQGALKIVNAERLRVVPACSFVRAYLGKHPEEKER